MKSINLKRNNNNGITLIALVITIIILLILAGVTIALLTGENGILTMANKAKTSWEDATQKEMHQLDSAMGYNQINSLYIWSLGDIGGTDKSKSINLTKLDYQVRTLNINTFYIQYGTDPKYGDSISDVPAFQVIMKYAEAKNIDVYLCDGEPNWYLDKDNTAIKRILSAANEYNQTATKRIKGFISDIEFYTDSTYQNTQNDDERKALIKNYATYSKDVCDLAASYNLGYAITLPFWLDNFGEELLNDFYLINFDHLAYMNYNRNYNIESLRTEIDLAKKYDKKVASIAELQPFDPSESFLTFYDVGLGECLKTFNTLSSTYNYDKLGFSYHYYTPLIDLIERQYSDATNYYEFVINPSIYGENVSPDQFKLVSDNNEEVSGYTFTSNQTTNIVFYGLKFNTNYHLTLGSGEHLIEKDINYAPESNETYVRNLGVSIAEKKYFTLILYGFLRTSDDASSDKRISLDGGKLVSANSTVTGSPVFSEGSNILYFRGLEYDKEYTLVLDNKTYTIVQGEKYNYPNQENNEIYDSVIVKEQ